MSRVEKLRQHVRRYWVIAETDSPQFGMASNPLSTASGVICVIALVINFFIVFYTVIDYNDIVGPVFDGRSPYKRSTTAIVITQSIGVVVGIIAPICISFSVFSFKLGTKWNRNYFMFFKVENYWVQKLHVWKQSPISKEYRSSTLIMPVDSWHEVEYKCKWLGNPLAKNTFNGKAATEIVKSFSDTAEQIVTEIKESNDGELTDNLPSKLIAANSMYRITQAILLRFQSNTEPITKKQLFSHLNKMIADIFCACFTNLPRVITMRCHESVIEKREASVRVAAKLYGKTAKIIEKLEKCDKVPSMDEDKMAYIDEWRLYMQQSIP
ncbi:hypothetical protein Hanom_Chr15g01348201 [Helianthus anomalus]